MNIYLSNYKLSRDSLKDAGIEGILFTISPLPFMLLHLNPDLNAFIAAISFIFFFISAFSILRYPFIGIAAAFIGICGTAFIVMPYIAGNPFTGFICSIVIISIFFYLYDFRLLILQNKISEIQTKEEHIRTKEEHKISKNERAVQRCRWGTITLFLVIIFRLIIKNFKENSSLVIFNLIINIDIADIALISSFIILQIVFLQFSLLNIKNVLPNINNFVSIFWSLFSIAAIGAIIFLFNTNYNIFIAASLLNIINLLILPKSKILHNRYGHWWEIFLNHPARMMLTTFMGLCIGGTLLLSLPAAASKDAAINIIDAAFTSVSAVCVTGLIVLDTPNDFSIIGQIFILLLIQLGGLGIMSITTVGMHVMGRRLTLRQERLMTTITDTDHKDLILSLASILKFTFAAESLGFTILTMLFYNTGDSFGQALWRGGFTAISAFCNAGFALQSTNLVPYNSNPLILHTVAALIIFGGIAPATTLLIPRLIAGRAIAPAPYIAIITTLFLLISGTIFILIFDWNGVLSGLSLADKINNAWFQSVTLRTAGFNSVDIAGVSDPAFLIMICLMFIGGSPGGTAGGIKTTTIGILVLTFLANITNHKSVVILNRRIQSRVIYRAVTIAGSGVLIWIITVMMLEITQQIPAKDIIFEVTSAIGTVGLSTGATAKLDEIGKVIIMIAMFAGRVGPITLFMLLSGEHSDKSSRYQNAKISLT